MARRVEADDDEVVVRVKVSRRLLTDLVRSEDDWLGKALVRKEIMPDVAQLIADELYLHGLLSREDLPVGVVVEGDDRLELPGDFIASVERRRR